MIDNNANKPKPDEAPGRGGSAKKPRGLGGVILIMALLLALFVMISRSGMEREASIYDFYGHLFNGRIQTTDWTDGKVIAQVQDPGDPQKRIKIEVVLDKSVAEDAALIQELLPFGGELDRTYASTGGIRRFKERIEDGEIGVKRAIFVSEYPSKQPSSGTQEPAPGRARHYLTALIAEGDTEKLCRVDPDETDPANTLLTVRELLLQRGVPVQDRPLALDPRTLRIEQPNTALFYFLGTIGPWLLVLIIVWFFIIRQMRAPGGSGGVLSFGRSRAALYTKENRTNVTF